MDQTAAEFYMPEPLPQLPPEQAAAAAADGLEQYSGHMRVPNPAQHVFFWLVQTPPPQRGRRTLVVWLNGGPGCSSMDGLFLENGPWRFRGSQLEYNRLGWHQLAHVLYVDQPVGAGFSFADNGDKDSPRDQTAMADAFVRFSARFVAVFPQYRGYDVVLAGESYAGTYIPYIAHALLALGAKAPFRVAAAMIGNGWIDPVPQYASYVSFGRQSGLLTGAFATRAQAQLEKCLPKLDGHKITHNACEAVLEQVTLESRQNGRACVNLYNVKLRDPPGAPADACGMAWPNELGSMRAYLNSAELQRAIHLSGNRTWAECNDHVSTLFAQQTSPPAATLLPGLLAQIPVLLFNGDLDFLCNYVGVDALAGALAWNGGVGWGDAAPLEWHIDGQLAGEWRTARNLSVVRVYGASHMLPYDAPLQALHLFSHILGTSSLSGIVESTSVITPPAGTAPRSSLGLLALLLLLGVLAAVAAFVCRRRAVPLPCTSYACCGPRSRRPSAQTRSHWSWLFRAVNLHQRQRRARGLAHGDDSVGREEQVALSAVPRGSSALNGNSFDAVVDLERVFDEPFADPFEAVGSSEAPTGSGERRPSKHFDSVGSP